MRATFEYDPREQYRASRAVARFTSTRYVAWVFAAGALLLLYWNVLRFWGEYPALTLFWSGLPWLLLAGFWLGLMPWTQWRAAQKLPRVDPSVIGPQVREVNDSGFRSEGNGVVLELPWHAMHQAVETEEFLLFFYSKQLAYYLPKRVVAPPALAELRLLMQAKLGSRARNRARGDHDAAA